MIKKGNFYLTIFCASLVLLLAWAVIRINVATRFDEEVTGYLDNYVEAGTVEAAKENMELAINALEERGLTEGQVSIFYKNPNNNIGLWYNNLIESRRKLDESIELSSVQQAIILEKQRDGLKGGASSESSSIKRPDGIEIYPYNKLFFWWSIVALAFAFVSGIACLVVKENYEWDDLLIEPPKNDGNSMEA